MKYIWLVFFSVFLFGCDHEKTESYYVTHPQALQRTLSHCSDEMTPSCRVAYRAAQRITELSRLLMQDQMKFGQRILHAQIREAELQARLKIAEEKSSADLLSLKEQLKRQQQRVNELRAIVGLFVHT